MISHLCYENEDDRLEVTEARGMGDGRSLNVTGSRYIVDILQSHCPHKQEHRSYDVIIMRLVGTSILNVVLLVHAEWHGNLQGGIQLLILNHIPLKLFLGNVFFLMRWKCVPCEACVV